MISLVLDEALDPLIDTALHDKDPERALLALTVCDPACGSGHFLVAAARRLARALATARTGDPEPSPTAVRDAMRDVVSRCIYGVDLNDLALEVAKVALWLEAPHPRQAVRLPGPSPQGRKRTPGHHPRAARQKYPGRRLQGPAR
jgi:hypothetical protein